MGSKLRLVSFPGNCSQLDAALLRVTQAGGQIAMPRMAPPPGMGFIAKIVDLDGNKLGLHALG